MTITKTLLLAAISVASLAGPAMAQANNDAGQLYWSERALQSAPPVGAAQALTHSFVYRSQSVNQGTVDFPSVGGGEGQ